ncbi:MAG: flagellar assembly protein FliH [Caulobacterales bacterium]
MAEPRKFNFDTEFGAGGAITGARAPYRRLYSAEEVAHLQAVARAEGEAAESERAEALSARALADMAEAVRAALPSLAAAAHEHRVGSAGLALAAARQIADAACDRFPEAPLQAALAALAREVESTPRLVLHAAPDLLERLQAALEETAQAIGFPGQIIAKADPAAPRAAFVLDWGDGRAEFDPAEAAQRVADALEAALASEGLHAEVLTPITPTPPDETHHG